MAADPLLALNQQYTNECSIIGDLYGKLRETRGALKKALERRSNILATVAQIRAQAPIAAPLNSEEEEKVKGDDK